MQYADGRGWRQKVREELKPLNITVFDPYDKPFVKNLNEDETVRATFKTKLENGEYDFIQDRMREIRIFDLNLVDRSDFIIAHIIPSVASWGSAEELVWSCRLKKPTFISVEGGKKCCPLWILGMFPHRYIYNNIDEILNIIKGIDSGDISINNDRWRLLRPEYR
jgi:hypothetical protein